MKKLFLITYLTLITLAPAIAAEVKITLKDQAQVTDSTVRVSDIAMLKGDAEMLKQIGNCKIASSPLIGYEKIIAQDYLRLRLKQQKVALETVEISGAKEVKVTRRSKLLTGKVIFEQVKDPILAQLPWSKENVLLSTYRDAEDIYVPEAEISYEVELINEAVSGRRLNVEITVLADGEEFVTVPLALKLSRFVDVVIARRAIARNDIVAVDDLYLSREEMSPRISSAYFAIEELVGKQAVSQIKENHIITDRMVAMPLVVKRRQIATLVYEKNNLFIRTKVQAKENGRIGDIIRVINPETKKEFLAQVVDNGLLRYAL